MEELLRRLPGQWRLAPIHRKGSCNSEGKTPLDESRKEDFDAHKVLDKLRSNLRYSAVGVWMGPRSGGLICVDVDHEDGTTYIHEKYGADALPASFSVKSPVAGHIKHFYTVPPLYWGSGKGDILSSNDGMFEILWDGRQGIILGEHPDGGYYEWVTPVEDLAPAPQWLLNHAFNDKIFFKLPQKILATSFTEEEAEIVVRNALSAIPNPNRGEPGEVLYDEWYKILCSVHDALPNDKGLALFEEWASQSDKYEPGYAERRSWPYLSASSRDGKSYRTFGHLIQELRDRDIDPVPQQFQHRVLLKNSGETPALNLAYDELIEQIRNIYLQPAPARVLYDLTTLSKATRFPVATLTAIYEKHLRFLTGTNCMTAADLVGRYSPEKTLCVIPDLLVQGSVVLLHGDSGSGKSYLAYNIAKAVVQGAEFKGYRARQGTVLIFQSDENPIATSQRLQYMGIDEEDNILFVQGWTFDQTLKLRTYLEQYKPLLCIFDSLSSSNLTSGVSENDPAYAAPLTQLTNEIIPAYNTTAIVLHHNNRNGEFRGTSAIKAAVDEMWEIRRPTAADVNVPQVGAAIIDITKSRMDLWGSWLATYDPDTRVYHSGPWERYVAPEDGDADTQPQTTGDRVRLWFESRNDDEYYTYRDLHTAYTFVDVPLPTIKSAVTSLVNRGVLERFSSSQRPARFRATNRRGLQASEEVEVVAQPVQPSAPESVQPPAPEPLDDLEDAADVLTSED